MDRTIPRLIPYANNQYLTRISQSEEIKIVMHNIDGNYALDPYDFREWFFQVHWVIVEINVINSIKTVRSFLIPIQ